MDSSAPSASDARSGNSAQQRSAAVGESFWSDFLLLLLLRCSCRFAVSRESLPLPTHHSIPHNARCAVSRSPARGGNAKGSSDLSSLAEHDSDTESLGGASPSITAVNSGPKKLVVDPRAQGARNARKIHVTAKTTLATPSAHRTFALDGPWSRNIAVVVRA